MFPLSTTRARGRVPEMLYLFVQQSVYKSLLLNEIKSRVLKYSNMLKWILGKQTEKNLKKKSLNRNILSTDISTLPLYFTSSCPHRLHSTPSGKQYEPLTGIWGIDAEGDRTYTHQVIHLILLVYYGNYWRLSFQIIKHLAFYFLYQFIFHTTVYIGSQQGNS